MFRGPRRRLVCTGKACRRNCESWELGVRGESRLKKKRRIRQRRRVGGDGTETKLASGYVLAGGGSTRFGRDKALVEIGGAPMLLRMRSLLAGNTNQGNVVAAPHKYAPLGVTWI